LVSQKDEFSGSFRVFGRRIHIPASVFIGSLEPTRKNWCKILKQLNISAKFVPMLVLQQLKL
jgi:hypothetical protein